ncbi:iron dicitrate transport regulator FecR [Caulobacter vibrioides]|nr:iron dicitrate transport regulator FecR [Caulobacter vibrioides]
MTERESAADIEAAAARWVVRADRGDLDPAELEAWLAADTRRQGAFVRTQAAWGLLDRGRVLGAQEGQDAPRRRIGRRGLLAGLGAAAAACVAVVAAPRLLSARYGTTVGEIRRVPLADGSLAAINTDTALEVAMKPRKREVRLDRGEAWFQVAKDAERPFVVESGPVRVRAVGTAFSVRRRDGGCEVLVTEGVVEVWSEGAGEAPRRVTAGERVFASDSAGAARPVSASLEITRELAWREGQIVLDGEAFGAAAEEFNRYNARKIVIADPVLAEQKLVGWFRTNEPESFARAAAASFGARVTVRGDAILVQSAAPLAE